MTGSLLQSVYEFLVRIRIIEPKDNKFYIGSTNYLKRRVKEHQAGKNTSTAKRLPVELIYYEAHLSKSDALRREKYYKTTKGKVTLKQLLRDSLKFL